MASLLPVHSFKSSYICRRCTCRLFHSTPSAPFPRIRFDRVSPHTRVVRSKPPPLLDSERKSLDINDSQAARNWSESKLPIRTVVPHLYDPKHASHTKAPSTARTEDSNDLPVRKIPTPIRDSKGTLSPETEVPHLLKQDQTPNQKKNITYSPLLSDDFNWYWETLAPTIAQKTAADTYFVKKARPQFLRSVPRFRQFPAGDVPEVAFVGRSNVGKSSLLNALVNADIKALLARTSPTPGFTKTMNLYGMGPHDGGVRIKPGISGQHDHIVGVGGLLVVDMPGYGEGSLIEWGVEIMKYLTKRKQLRRVFVLIDAQVGLKDKDRYILAQLRLAGVSHQVILSKLDKIFIPPAKNITHVDPKSRLNQSLAPKGSLENVRAVMEAVKKDIKPDRGAGALGELLGVSAEVKVNGRRLGIDAVRASVLNAVGISLGVVPSRKQFASEKWVD
jgi:GTP-binding protein